jgi:hypothetical protein
VKRTPEEAAAAQKLIDLRRQAVRQRPKASGKLRSCMTCGAMFVSTGSHHRMCDDCRVSSQDMSPFEPMVEWGQIWEARKPGHQYLCSDEVGENYR